MPEQPFKVVIPARYASTRLPGKPLLDIAGKPMVVHVCESAKKANAEEIIVATDDTRIHQCVQAAGFESILTQKNHNSGTERIAEVAERKNWSATDIIVNLQGDEPLMPPELIQQTAAALALHSDAGTATLASPISEHAIISNPNTVKVILDRNGYALYFSRAPIPWNRDNPGTMTSNACYLRHIGLYAYTVDFIQRYVGWPASPLETIESLEQLRILWHGEKIFVHTVVARPHAGVDTPEDLKRVERIIKANA